MTAPSVYFAGTATVTAGSATVNGSGTAWAITMVTGGMFSFAGMSVPILSVESDTSLTLAYPWPGATATGPYAIARETSRTTEVLWVGDELRKILVKLSLVGIHPNGSGSLAERNALNPAPTAGYIWLRIETGFDLVFYKKTVSGWDGPFDARGDVGPPGPIGPAGPDGDITWSPTWSLATAYLVNQAAPHNGSSYVCTANHVAAAANEPGIGASWATVWDLMAAKGAQGATGPGVTDGDKGDIVVSGGGATWAVDSNAITYAKMQDVSATARVLGRKTAGAGDPEELTLSDMLDMVGSAATGDILFKSAGGWTRLPKGTGLQILRQNTALTAPEWATAREVLTAVRTYYVRTDGNDANTGLVNNAGGAFLTIQAAENAARKIDFNGFTVTISIGDGTYTGSLTVGAKVGQAAPTNYVIDSTSGVAANVIISTSGNAITCNERCFVSRVELRSTSGSGLSVAAACVVQFGGTRFGVCGSTHLSAEFGGTLYNVGTAYSIVGGSGYHFNAGVGGSIFVVNTTITLTGTPAFGGAFMRAHTGGSAQMNGNTFSGSATGVRYQVLTGGAIQTFGAGATYFPGSSAGTGGTTAGEGYYA